MTQWIELITALVLSASAANTALEAGTCDVRCSDGTRCAITGPTTVSSGAESLTERSKRLLALLADTEDATLRRLGDRLRTGLNGNDEEALSDAYYALASHYRLRNGAPALAASLSCTCSDGPQGQSASCSIL